MPKLTQDTRPDIDNVIQVSTSKPLGLIPAWSHSTLKTFETCAYRSYIAKVKRISEDYGPAAKRGSEIHEQAEHYVAGTLGEMPDTLHKFTKQFEHLRKLYNDSKVELEGEWGFTIEWEACHWMAKDVWARIKLDAIVHENDTSARVIDHGTVTEQSYTRDQALLFLPKLHERAMIMTTAEKFPPNPSKTNCKWCSYKNGEEPACQWGII
jgi:hypothetical protein